MKKIYLATAFAGVEEISYQCANEVASKLIARDDCFVFSPITHSYPLWKTGFVPHTYEVWLKQDRAFVEWSDAIYLIVFVKEDGDRTWGTGLVNKSTGVQKELGWCTELGKELKHVYYNITTKELVIE